MTTTKQMLEELEELTIAQLRDRYAEAFGEATRSGNRQWLLRRIAWRLQALAATSACVRRRIEARHSAPTSARRRAV
ncbi:MAG: DUF2924 domain-containing protein [Planctomycetota bacterium]|jgi:hypothetical protein